MHVAIIGNGIAGMEAAKRIRDTEPTWRISIISEESEHFFSRPALLYILSGQLSHRCTEPYERDHYEEHRFERIRARVNRVDVENSALHFEDGRQPLGYDRLLITCGARARPAPWKNGNATGIGYFVTHQDLQWLQEELFGKEVQHDDVSAVSSSNESPYRTRKSARALRLNKNREAQPKELAVIGGGLIGIEVIEAMLSAGYKPNFFIREEWFWPMALSKKESMWIAKKLENHGVRIRLEHEVEGFVVDDLGCVSAIKSDRGTFNCDLCVTAIGVIPNTAWLSGSDIEIDRRGGIVVNKEMKSSAKNIFAAGDCAFIRDGESGFAEYYWYGARDQGRVAADSIMGKDANYHRSTYYNSAKLMDIEYTTVGETTHDDSADFYFEEKGRVESTTRIATKENVVCGFNLLGRRWDHQILIRWIEEKRSLEWVLDNLNSAAFDTEFVKPLRLTRNHKGQ